jgi:RNA polymerase sigma-70 factor (ECF subfamily)
LKLKSFVFSEASKTKKSIDPSGASLPVLRGPVGADLWARSCHQTETLVSGRHHPLANQFKTLQSKEQPMDPSDGTFVTRARSGDSDAFRTLVERHSRPVFRLAFRMTGNEQDAEDVVQESMLRAYKQLGKFDQRASFGTWLYRIATNCSLDLVRARKRRAQQQGQSSEGDPEDIENPVSSVPSPDPNPERIALSGEVRDRLTSALDELSATERSAFVLRHFEGMHIEEIGRVLGCQTGAAKHSVFRAVQKLRRALEPVVGAAR